MPATIEATRVLLQSDDGLWYWLELMEDEGSILPYCDGVAVGSGAAAYAILSSNSANTYRLSLNTIGTDVVPYIDISPGVESPESVNLNYGTNRYSLTVIEEEASYTLLVTDLGLIPAGATAHNNINATPRVGNWRVNSATRYY